MKKVFYLLSQLDDADAAWLREAGERRTLAPGAVLIAQGQAVEDVFIVLDGRLEVLSYAGQLIAELEPGEIVGELSFLDRQPPNATVTVSKPATVLAFPRAALAEKLETDTRFAARFFRGIAIFLADRLRGTVASLGYDVGPAVGPGVEIRQQIRLEHEAAAKDRFDALQVG